MQMRLARRLGSAHNAAQRQMATASDSNSEPLIRNVSDTALWAAVFRGWENARRNAVFHDPYAQSLAGDRGAKIAREVKFGTRHAWSWIARTYAVDEMIRDQLAEGADMFINLAAGLDTRPYRMSLPAALTWVEIDLPGILDYKQSILAREQPKCKLERVRLDLSDGNARRPVFAQLANRAKRAVIISEGLIIYLTREQVAALAQDLAAQPSFQYWIVDVTSPALLRMMRQRMGSHLEAAGAPLRFAPEEGPDFFLRYGWKPVRVESMLHTAARIHRLPLWMRFFSIFPPTFPPQGKRPWGGAVLLARDGGA
jgi:methyltransferase (TIGR00027 family)